MLCSLYRAYLSGATVIMCLSREIEKKYKKYIEIKLKFNV